jgi:hypothetical protein
MRCDPGGTNDGRGRKQACRQPRDHPWRDRRVGHHGLIVALVLYRKSRRLQKISYLVRSFDLITNSASRLPDFAATYKGRPLRSLTASRLMMWNAGTAVINESDVASTDRIRVVLPTGAWRSPATGSFGRSRSPSPLEGLRGRSAARSGVHGECGFRPSATGPAGNAPPWRRNSPACLRYVSDAPPEQQ